MSDRVIDAGIVAAMLFKEEYAEASVRVLAQPGLQAPDLLHTEVGSAVWKRWRRGEIDAAYASEMMSDCLKLPVRTTPSTQLLELAMEIATQTDRTVYDCLYVALAIQIDSSVITTDKRLVNALSSGTFRQRVIWIGDL